MKPKKRVDSMDDGDSAHWVKSTKRKVSVADSGRTAKYTGKRKTRKRVVTKK